MVLWSLEGCIYLELSLVTNIRLFLLQKNINEYVAKYEEYCKLSSEHNIANPNDKVVFNSLDEEVSEYLASTFINCVTHNKLQNIKRSELVHILDSKGVREHVCEVLEGGDTAFKLREKKYAIK